MHRVRGTNGRRQRGNNSALLPARRPAGDTDRPADWPVNKTFYVSFNLYARLCAVSSGLNSTVKRFSVSCMDAAASRDPSLRLTCICVLCHRRSQEFALGTLRHKGPKFEAEGREQQGVLEEGQRAPCQLDNICGR